MDSKKVTIRLLDPPLHEFLPSTEDKEIMTSLASNRGTSLEELKRKIEQAKGRLFSVE